MPYRILNHSFLLYGLLFYSDVSWAPYKHSVFLFFGLSAFPNYTCLPQNFASACPFLMILSHLQTLHHLSINSSTTTSSQRFFSSLPWDRLTESNSFIERICHIFTCLNPYDSQLTLLSVQD